MTQPEALRLADALTCPTYPDWVMHIPAPWHPPAQEVRKAAAELRRLHAECNDLAHQLNESNERNGRLKAQRDALLEKIKAVIAAEQSEGAGRGGFVNTPPTREHQRRVAQAWKELHAAIKAVEEGK